MDSKKILVVEDEQALRGVYVDVLNEAGYSVQTAADGEEGLAKVKSFEPDLILLDIFIPKISGFDVIEKLSKDPKLSRIPIIVLTNIYIDREELVKKGVKYCFIKAEVTPTEVLTKVKETLVSESKLG